MSTHDITKIEPYFDPIEYRLINDRLFRSMKRYYWPLNHLLNNKDNLKAKLVLLFSASGRRRYTRLQEDGLAPEYGRHVVRNRD